MTFRPLLRYGLIPAILLAWGGDTQADPIARANLASGGVTNSLTIVNGCPAVAWMDYDDYTVKYSRALDAAGKVWGTPITVASAIAWGLQLRMINGNPAVCYRQPVSQQEHTVRFVRAADTAGTAWGLPVTVQTAMNPYFYMCPTMEVVEGNPAIVYADEAGLRFVRAADANGTAWNTALTADTLPGIQHAAMTIVSGHPAMAFGPATNVMYIRAADAAGSSWNPRVTTATVTAAWSTGMQIVSGQPAISCYDGGMARLLYMRATDAEGAAWGAPVAVASDGSSSGEVRASLATINGKPAMAWYVSGKGLQYVQANNATGSAPGSWGTPSVLTDSWNSTGQLPSLLEVNGRPALTHYFGQDRTLQFLRAADSDGSRWLQELGVAQMGSSTPIPNGGKLAFINNWGGGSLLQDLDLRSLHSNRPELNILAMTIDGPDADEFSLYNEPASPLTASASTQFSVLYDPVRAGRKTATLHIVTDMENPPASYDIVVTGETLPDIMLSRDGLAYTLDDRTHCLPVTPAGGTRDFIFKVENWGGAELNSLAVTFSGPDAAEFSLISGPPAQVAAGSQGSFTVRHSATSGGARYATLHVASNVEGSKNPYDVVLKMAPGGVDWSFQSGLPQGYKSSAMALTPAGKILVASSTAGVKRFSSEGAPDNTFQEAVVTAGVQCMAVQKDGKILIGGSFSSVSGQERKGLARLQADGSLDSSFVPPELRTVSCLTIQPDGKILAGGTFFFTGRQCITRLHADGSPDASFSAAPNNSVRCVALQPDGRIVIGGEFGSVGGTVARYIARLLSNGTPEPFYNGFNAAVNKITIQPDGRLLTLGNFTPKIARLRPEGTLDPTLTFSTPQVSDLGLQADGACVAGGGFNTIGGVAHNGLARITPGGGLDPVFRQEIIGLMKYEHLALQADGRLVAPATSPYNTSGGALAFYRFYNDPAFSELKATDSMTVRWLRSGSAPEIRDVTFDMKTAGATDWTRLGTGTRIAGGWELTALTLPSSGSLRAQGYAGGSVMEDILTLPTPLEAWRLEHFQTSANTGNAADGADPDLDGLTNLVEFAFGLSPVNGGGGMLPSFILAGDSLVASFIAPGGREDIEYRAEWSASLEEGTWAGIADTGTGNEHVFHTSGGGQRVFVRFVVSVRQ